MTKLSTIIIFLLSARAWAQPSLAPPQLGFVQDSASALRPAYGIAGNFILGKPVADEIVSAAFSGSFGLVKTAAALTAFDSQGKTLASIAAAAGPALFAFSSDGKSGLAYTPSDHALIEWSGNAFLTIASNLDLAARANVIAIAFPNPSQASLIVSERSDLWEFSLSLTNSPIVSRTALPGIPAPVLALPSGNLLYADDAGLVIRASGASEVHIPAQLPKHFSLQQMNNNWVQLTDLASSARFAIRTASGHVSFSRLPEANQ